MKYFIFLASLFLMTASAQAQAPTATPCQLRAASELGNLPTYRQPVDDAHMGDAGLVKTILTVNHPYRCTEVSPNGYVRVQHGGAFQFTSWIPLSAFVGNSAPLTDGRTITDADFTGTPQAPSPDIARRQTPRTGNEISGENFMDFFRGVSPDGPHGGRYQLPMSGANSNEGPCGGLHIRGHRTRPYMTPLTACLFAGVSQEWR